jgi:thiosulfate/3-mercaptopyruvate sulfurtransferase
VQKERNVSKALRNSFLSAAAGWLLVAAPSIAAGGIKGNLVDISWLENHLKSADVLILDASPAQLYAANHIPGAVNVDLMTYGLQEKPIGEMEKEYQSWGISPGKTLVVYDPGGNMIATRAFFSLYYHGFPENKLFILDGGLSKWREKGLPVTKDVTPAPRPGSFKIKTPNENVRARLPEFLTASGDPVHNALVEGLGPDWHFGGVVVFEKGGHIPHGILLPSADFYNPDKTFKSPDEIRRMVTYLGIRPEQQIYTYCGGGVAASVPFFALKFILNYPRVKLYIESELGWLSDERGLPYWTYDVPTLMREAGWLQFWTSQRVRSTGLARVSVVDVRPPAEFNQGHVPYALNIPAEVFRKNYGDPGKLAQELGPAGVDASHEAVVISGAGLTKEAALAYAMLEKLGQEKVSVLLGSMDNWAHRGFTVTREAASIKPTTYPARLRDGVIISDARSTQGVYPKVFLASGKAEPSRAPDGKVVHVPYGDLLNAEGAPKPAKDIWNILTKAGVPRYAELVCFSDDPGEAAANYFILKLMGYPDVKVLGI